MIAFSELTIDVSAVVGGVSLLFCSALCIVAIKQGQLRRRLEIFKQSIFTRVTGL